MPPPIANEPSSDFSVTPFISWEGFGAVYIPFPREAPAGLPWSDEKEQVGSYTTAAFGLGVCLGPRNDCDRREGFRLGILAETGRMLNGFGYWFFGGKILAGNENVSGFLEAGASWYPTGGFYGEPGDHVFKSSLGAGIRVIPHLKYFPFAIPLGVRFDPTDPLNGGIYLGFGGAQ